MHFKRKRAKSRRNGCLFCKPHKANGCGHTGKTTGLNMRSQKRMEAARFELTNRD